MKLSPMQIWVLKAYAAGLRGPQIAQQRGVSVKTVEGQAQSAKEKLQADTITHAVAIAMRERIIE